MAEKKNFARLLDRMTPESRAFIEEKAHQLNAEMDLAELRRARRLSQEQLAGRLKHRAGGPECTGIEKAS